MKYIVTRTSLYKGEKPCDEAFKHPHPTGQLSNVERWTIEINSLEQLNAFAEKYEPLIVYPESYFGKSPEIEIYDDYKE